VVNFSPDDDFNLFNSSPMRSSFLSLGIPWLSTGDRLYPVCAGKLGELESPLIDVTIPG
jgi:hypothetical protein